MRSPILIIVAFINITIASGQGHTPYKTHVGIAIGMNKVVEAESKIGMNLGVNVYYYPLHFVGVSFKPDLAMYSYKIPNNPGRVQSAQFELPLHSVLRIGKGLVRPVAEVGPDWILDVSGAGNPSRVGWDLAGGVEMRMMYFSFIPEVRYSSSREIRMIYFTLNFLG